MNAPTYLTLVQHDLKTLEALTEGAASRKPPLDVSDWKCTLTFYMACIYVKAIASSRSVELQDHYQLRQWLNTTGDLLTITRSYRKLEERSRDARYEGRLFSAAELGEALRWYIDVRNRIVALLSAAGTANVPVADPSPWLR